MCCYGNMFDHGCTSLVFLRSAMVVYLCDIHKVSRLLTGKKGQLKKEVPSVAMMTNFGFGPYMNFSVDVVSYISVTYQILHWRLSFSYSAISLTWHFHKTMYFKEIRLGLWRNVRFPVLYCIKRDAGGLKSATEIWFWHIALRTLTSWTRIQSLKRRDKKLCKQS